MGHEWRSKWICAMLVVSQIGTSVAASKMGWGAYCFTLFSVGGTFAQALFLAVHELTHDLFFASPSANRWFAMVANLPLVFPFSVPFRAYHLDHHRYMGVEDKDMDMPSSFEKRWIKGRFGKGVWCSLQILAYALRPLLQKPLPVTRTLVWSWILQIGFDALLVWWWGSAPLRFLALSVLVAGGVHPCAGHFLTEHYSFSDGRSSSDTGVENAEAADNAENAGNKEKKMQETFSYYGPLNLLSWNVGYHVEHHDFPRAPWSRLPQLKSLSPEMYVFESPPWEKAALEYVFRSDMGPHRRVRRTGKAED